MILGSICLQFLGTLWLAVLTNTTLLQAAFSAVIPFLPNDILKIIITITFAPVVKKQISQISME